VPQLIIRPPNLRSEKLELMGETIELVIVQRNPLLHMILEVVQLVARGRRFGKMLLRT
jgi:hypothetical protein